MPTPENHPQSEFSYPESQLHAITTLDGRYRKEISEMEPFSSEASLISYRAKVEAVHLIALSESQIIRPINEDERKILNSYEFSLSEERLQRVKELESVSDHDVDAVRNMMREELSETTLSDIVEHVHYLLTSEDVNNLAYRLMVKDGTREVVIPTLDSIVDKLIEMSLSEKDTVMLARTHGQPAVPTTLGKELVNFAVRINKEILELKDQELTGKLNGAVGNFNAHKYAEPDVDWQSYAENIVDKFNLDYNPFTTQINPYEDLIKTFQTYQRINGIFTNLDQDIWRYISDKWFIQRVEKGETGSSTMPQKVNPIRFENSEGNLSMSTALFEGMGRKLGVSRLQRDLSDSTVIRNAPTAISFGLLAYKNTLRGLGRIHPNHQEIEEALNEDWGMLTEGVQVYLRKQGVDNAYELIKLASRGKHIDKKEWRSFIDSLEISDSDKNHLKELSPSSYLGMASELVDQAVGEIRYSRNERNKTNS